MRMRSWTVKVRRSVTQTADFIVDAHTYEQAVEAADDHLDAEGDNLDWQPHGEPDPAEVDDIEEDAYARS